MARSGRLIVELSTELSEGDILYDQKENKVARVAELIGPVSAPFASAIPYENVRGNAGAKMYAVHSPAEKRRLNSTMSLPLRAKCTIFPISCK